MNHTCKNHSDDNVCGSSPEIMGKIANLLNNKSKNILTKTVYQYFPNDFRNKYVTSYNPNLNTNISKVLISGGNETGKSLKWNLPKIKNEIGHIPWTINGGFKQLEEQGGTSFQPTNFYQLSADEIEFIKLMFHQTYSELLNIEFKYLGDASGNPGIYNKSILDLSFFDLSLFGIKGLEGLGIFPIFTNSPNYTSIAPSGCSYYNSVSGIANGWLQISPILSNYLRWLLLHEVGHTMGLRHPFDSNITLKGVNKTNNGTYGGDYNQNYINFTVMAYNSQFQQSRVGISLQTLFKEPGFPFTLGTIDIAALHFFYNIDYPKNKIYNLFDKNSTANSPYAFDKVFLDPNYKTLYGKDIVINIVEVDPSGAYQVQDPVILDLRTANLKYDSDFGVGYISCYKAVEIPSDPNEQIKIIR